MRPPALPGQLAAGTCEIVTLDRDSSQPRRTIARQTARCACRKGQIAGTTRARPACVDVNARNNTEKAGALTVVHAGRTRSLKIISIYKKKLLRNLSEEVLSRRPRADAGAPTPEGYLCLSPYAGGSTDATCWGLVTPCSCCGPRGGAGPCRRLGLTADIGTVLATVNGPHCPVPVGGG
ncbi:Protein FAM19A5 [Tupaia chinensis]|uniref:Protein FAM19A5 n=1 Tax=Tupaia chinensis TaxID=246437 RepID=L9JIU3_TUPCH|nr:Protein FAM19A5 [Tupaia chinensis]